jgi:hypothetical protein
MISSNRQIHIFYRHVHVKADKTSRDPNKTRPSWFSHEVCFRNLLATIRSDLLGNRVKLTIVYDGPVEDFASDFIAKYYADASYGLNIQFIQGGSDLNSFLITLALARSSEFDPNDLIYFLENDYLHQHGWVSKVFELYEGGLPFDYLSLYDHRDKYHYEMYATLTSKLVYSQTHHWRTAPSTCASFILEKRVLDRDYGVFSSGLTDYYFFSKLIGERGAVLLTPVPGLATHSMEGYLSPTVNWEKLAYEAAAEIIGHSHNENNMNEMSKIADE